MRLSANSFDEVSKALLDAFSEISAFRSIARCLDTQLQVITQDDHLPAIVERLIEWAETADKVTELIGCAQRDNPSNHALGRLDPSLLEEAPSAGELVERGGGATDFKDRLKEALGNLDTPGLQVLAAHELSELLRNASDEEADTLYLALLGNVKTERPAEVLTELVPVIAACLRRRIGDGARPDFNLARARLRRIDLSGLDLHEADVAFADLGHANLAGANLWRSLGYGVNASGAGLSRTNLEEARWHSAVAREARFHDCRMVSSVFKEADLAAAEFQQSRLQGAHFEGADLSGTRFEGALLADAFFFGAKVDEAAARTMALAIDWEKAYFDPPTRELIAESVRR